MDISSGVHLPLGSVRIVENELGESEIFRLISVNIDAERGSARLYWGSGGFAPSGVQGQSPWSGGLIFLQIWSTFKPF